MCLPVTPFKVEREWTHVGLSCAVVLARDAGHRCGYVRIAPGHALHGKDLDTPNVNVHGGLTFAELEPCTEHEDGQGWWFGFDCGHFDDELYDPNAGVEDCTTEEGRGVLEIHRACAHKYSPLIPEHYWTEAEVIAETERLAEQLAMS